MELLKQGRRGDLSSTLETKVNVQAGFGAVFYKWQDDRQFKGLIISMFCACVNVKLKKKRENGLVF